MYVCMNVCIFVYIYVCRYVCVCVCMFVYGYVCIYELMYVCMYDCTYVVCLCVYVCVCLVFGILKSCWTSLPIYTGSNLSFSKRYFLCAINRLVFNDKFWFYWCLLKLSRKCYNECTIQVYLGQAVCVNKAFCVCKTQM